ncbi:MAG: helix-turn-helix transcriptional regulator [Ichthyobacteriaceae bacterium]|nr:helix-turn-helix transcriptional regulator [Ichthyobacteriaceae bacterium]
MYSRKIETEDDSSLKSVQQHLLALIEKYEKEHWSNETSISDEQVKESDNAEKIVNAENIFIKKRKTLIKDKLKESGISQKDFGGILGHKPNYISELMNGIRPFSRDDIVVIHRLFDLDFNDLIPTFLKEEVTTHIKTTLKKLRNSKVGLKIKDFDLAE